MMSSVVIGHAYWRNSVKNDTVSANRIVYTIAFNTNGHGTIENYTDLQYDSGFELPTLEGNFDGWYVNSNLTGTKYNGYQEGINVFPSGSIVDYTITLHAKFN